jgi:oxygen-dependent protoporphyrinogen oxidase
MPQYLIGHAERVGGVDAAMSRFSGLVLAGAAYRGVGIPDCIKDGTAAATELVEYLRRPAA